MQPYKFNSNLSNADHYGMNQRKPISGMSSSNTGTQTAEYRRPTVTDEISIFGETNDHNPVRRQSVQHENLYRTLQLHRTPTERLLQGEAAGSNQFMKDSDTVSNSLHQMRELVSRKKPENLVLQNKTPGNNKTIELMYKKMGQGAEFSGTADLRFEAENLNEAINEMGQDSQNASLILADMTQNQKLPVSSTGGNFRFLQQPNTQNSVRSCPQQLILNNWFQNASTQPLPQQFNRGLMANQTTIEAKIPKGELLLPRSEQQASAKKSDADLSSQRRELPRRPQHLDEGQWKVLAYLCKNDEAKMLEASKKPPYAYECEAQRMEMKEKMGSLWDLSL